LRSISAIRVYDLSGRVQEYQQPTNTLKTTLQLNAGMYILEVETDDGVKEHRKVLVE